MSVSAEQIRLQDVQRRHLLDTPRETAFDRITALTALLLDMPIALITVVDEDRIWIKSAAGLEVDEVARETGLCGSAIQQDGVWVVEDARTDPRARGNGLVTGPLGLQAYAGAPLRMATGAALGTLSVIDTQPRTFSDTDLAVLTDLAGVVVDLLELRQVALDSLATVGNGRHTAADLQLELVQRRRSEEAQRMLADIMGLLFDAEDLHAELDLVARRTLPWLGQGCAISRMDDEGFRTTNVAALDPSLEPILGKARDASDEVNLDETPAVLRHVMDTRFPMTCTVEEALTWPGMPEAPGLREALEAMGAARFLFAPLLVRDEPVGAITFLSTDPGWTFDHEHVAIAVSVAERVAAAMENERLAAAEVQIAAALQSTLLPPMLPRIPGVDVAGRYRAAGHADIGGDFYDVFGNDGASWTILLGDVSGKGPEAAAIAGLARYTARALAMNDTSPEQILRQLNTAVGRQAQSAKFLTALCATVRPLHDGVELEIADAGHIPPMIRRADGRVEEITLHGTALGLFPDATVDTTTVHLSPGDTIVAVTDGATEARNAAGEFLRTEGLVSLLGRTNLKRASNIANRIVERVAAFDGGRPTDDLAVLVLRATDAGRT